MGRFKNESTKNPIYNWLLQQGFEYKEGIIGEKGLTKVYNLSDNYYHAYVVIDIRNNKIYVYKKSIVGIVGQAEMSLDKELLNDLDVFINKVDEFLEPWIGE